jgi:hypothetical protein
LCGAFANSLFGRICPLRYSPHASAAPLLKGNFIPKNEFSNAPLRRLSKLVSMRYSPHASSVPLLKGNFIPKNEFLNAALRRLKLGANLPPALLTVRVYGCVAQRQLHPKK